MEKPVRYYLKHRVKKILNDFGGLLEKALG